MFEADDVEAARAVEEPDGICRRLELLPLVAAGEPLLQAPVVNEPGALEEVEVVASPRSR